MKKGKTFLGALAIGCLFTASMGLTSCDNNKPKQEQYKIYELAKESGFTGTYEEWLESVKGADGKDGREIELSIENNKIVWRYLGETTWKEIYSINDLIGPKGDKGEDGKDGVSITEIKKTDTNELMDTYTIVYSDGTTSTFVVTNGKDGEQGIQGVPGVDGTTPTVSINKDGFWVINDVVTTIKAQGEKGEQGKSAYELYLEAHPNYKGTLEEWLDDLVNGRLGTNEEVYHSVKFITGTDETIPNQEVKHFYKVERPTDPIREGYTFEGWYVGDEEWAFSGYIVTENMTLTARWSINIYQISIDLGDGTPAKNYPYEHGSVIESLETPDETYQNFDHWEDEEGNVITFPYVVKGSHTIKAKYTEFNYGTIENPISIEEAVKIIKKLPESVANVQYFSKQDIYVKGKISKFIDQGSFYKIYIEDENGNEIYLYRSSMEENVPIPNRGDEIIAYGRGQNYMKINEIFDAKIVAITKDVTGVPVPDLSSSIYYNGSVQDVIVENEYYTVEGGSAKEAGTYKATLTLKDPINTTWKEEFDGTIEYTINKMCLDFFKPEKPLVYTGETINVFPDTALYTVEGGSALNAGDYVATFTLKDPKNFCWKSDFNGKFKYTIEPANITMPNVVIPDTTVDYTGKQNKVNVGIIPENVNAIVKYYSDETRTLEVTDTSKPGVYYVRVTFEPKDKVNYLPIDLVVDSKLTVVHTLNVKVNGVAATVTEIELDDNKFAVSVELKVDDVLTLDINGTALKIFDQDKFKANVAGVHKIYVNQEDQVFVVQPVVEVKVTVNISGGAAKELVKNPEPGKEKELMLTGLTLKANDELVFKIGDEILKAKVKDGANNVKKTVEGKLIVINDKNEAEVYLEKTKEGYALWVTGYVNPNPIIKHETIYLKPNANWLNANARFAARVWDDAGNKAWFDLKEVEKGVYGGKVPAGEWRHIIYCRMNPNAPENGWDNKWNQTADLDFVKEDLYTVEEGNDIWDKGPGTWSTYVPSTQA